jgi:hypothetical protein
MPVSSAQKRIVGTAAGRLSVQIVTTWLPVVAPRSNTASHLVYERWDGSSQCHGCIEPQIDTSQATRSQVIRIQRQRNHATFASRML